MKRYLPPILSIFTLILLLLSSSCDMESLKEKMGMGGPKGPDSLLLVSIAGEIKNTVSNFEGNALGIDNKNEALIDTFLMDFYQESDYQMRWFDIYEEKRDSSTLEDVIIELEAAGDHGLVVNDYKVERVKKLNQYINNFMANPEMEAPPIDSLIRFDLLLTSSFLSYATDLLKGRTKAPKRWEVTERHNDLAASLSQAMEINNMDALVKTAAPKIKNYWGLLEVLAQYEEIAKKGGWTEVPKGKFSKGKSNEAIQKLAKRLQQSGDLKGKTDKMDDALIAAIKKFQARHNLNDNGSVDSKTLEKLNTDIQEDIQSIKMNINRYRWMPDTLGQKYLHVNIPESHLRFYDGEEVIIDMPVVVGAPKSPTPVMFKELQYMVFSPVWHVPPSIARDEIIKYAKINPNVILVSDVEVYKDGRKIDAWSVDWPNVNDWNRYRFKQKPSANQNALGRVKFMFPNHHSCYMHDTYNKQDFANRVRAESAGCVRVPRPVDLSYEILKDKDWTKEKVSRAMNRNSEQRVNVSPDIPIYFSYFTKWVDDEGILQSRRDIYKQDSKQLKALAAK